jgi:hypothetical protein
VIWLVLPSTREVVVVTPEGDKRYRSGEILLAHPELPGLEPRVDLFFRQLVR